MAAFQVEGTDQGNTAPEGARARSPRRRVLLTGMFHSLTGSHRAAIRNLSCTGASISCDAPLKVGAEGVLQAAQLDCLCRVVWQKGQVYGVEFDEPLHNALVLELHRVTEHDVKRAESQAAREWFQAQAR